MTPQEIYNQVVAHLRQQNSQSLLETPLADTACAYRGVDGKKCAVGCVIEDSEYRPWMEGLSIGGILLRLQSSDPCPALCERLETHQGLLRGLQSVHDSYTPPELEGKFRRVAVIHDLQYTAPK
jgi:hypothetical protein